MNKKTIQPKTVIRRRVLLIAHDLVGERGERPESVFLRELSADWDVDLICARSREDDIQRLLAASVHPAPRAPHLLLEKCQYAISNSEYAALIVLDHPQTRLLLEPLSVFSRKPLIYVLPDGKRPVPAAIDGQGFTSSIRDREVASRQSCQAREIWNLAERPISRKWISSRLDALSSGFDFPPDTGMASIVIPAFNQIAHTRRCLDFLRRYTRGSHEIIIVDNGSSDGTAAFARSFGGIRLIRNEKNLGFAHAINQGMKASRGRYLIWLNNDVLVTPGWLEGLIACASRAPWIGVVGPCTNETVGIQKVETEYQNSKQMLRFAAAWHLKNRGRAAGAARLTGFCVLLKREVVDRVGLLDERFGLGCFEEYDYCLRVRHAGYDLVCARDVFVHHHGHASFANHEAADQQSRINRDVFLEKWCHQTLSFLDELNPVESTKPHA